MSSEAAFARVRWRLISFWYEYAEMCFISSQSGVSRRLMFNVYCDAILASSSNCRHTENH